MKQQQIKEKQNQAKDKTVYDNWSESRDAHVGSLICPTFWEYLGQRCYGLELQLEISLTKGKVEGMGNRRNSETVFATQKQNLPSTVGTLRCRNL